MEKLAAVGVGILMVIITCLITALPVMLAWNALIPELLGLSYLGFWDSLVLSILCSLLFKASSK